MDESMYPKCTAETIMYLDLIQPILESPIQHHYEAYLSELRS
jgi:hypothetical protein